MAWCQWCNKWSVVLHVYCNTTDSNTTDNSPIKYSLRVDYSHYHSQLYLNFKRFKQSFAWNNVLHNL